MLAEIFMLRLEADARLSQDLALANARFVSFKPAATKAKGQRGSSGRQADIRVGSE
jgi:hypothetical protein